MDGRISIYIHIYIQFIESKRGAILQNRVLGSCPFSEVKWQFAIDLSSRTIKMYSRLV